MVKLSKFVAVGRFYSTNVSNQSHVCIIGAGPSGFYAAQHLCKKLNNVKVDIYDEMPVPFGLVRYGVAPDHPEVKNVINSFSKTAELSNVRFLGNIKLGKDISLEQLKRSYHAILLGYGASQSKPLGIAGEKLFNVWSAKQVVGWYNGFPKDVDLPIDLSGTTVAIFGQGNVAIDVARILLSPVDKLKGTDITERSLQMLSTSNVVDVLLIGRRGPLQAAYTIKELREMLNLPGCHTQWRRSDFDGVADYVPDLPRPQKRIAELMLSSIKSQIIRDRGSSQVTFRPVFFRSPIEFTGTAGNDHIDSITLVQNRLETVGKDVRMARAETGATLETLACNMAITSIGYSAYQADDTIPFDYERGIVLNSDGVVHNHDGVFVSGWLGQGPVGVLLRTMSNSFFVAQQMVNYVNKLTSSNISAKGGYQDVKNELKSHPIVDWNGWRRIDAYELEEGKKRNKTREKVVSVEKMLEIAIK